MNESRARSDIRAGRRVRARWGRCGAAGPRALGRTVASATGAVTATPAAGDGDGAPGPVGTMAGIVGDAWERVARRELVSR